MAKAIAAAAGDQPEWKAAPQRLRSFLKDVRSEMRKVVSPSWPEVQTTTTVVVITVFAFAAYFWLVDNIIGKAIETMLRKLIGAH